MKRSLVAALFFFLFNDAEAQNTGIGTLFPQRTLHVGGGMRIDTLAGAGNGFIKFDNVGDLIRFPQSGNVLDVLRGDGSWGTPGYQAANNTILVSGNLIAGNYQPANNTITLAGNLISGNYQAADNTITLTGNTISGNYQAGNNTVSVTGNTITGNYQAGTGVNITGNVITATGNNLWVPDVNGIHNFSGKVGIGGNSHPNYPLNVRQANSGVGHAVAFFESDDTWHGAIALKNNVSNKQYTFIVAANAPGYPTQSGAFAIINDGVTYSMVINGTTNFIGIGPRPITDPVIVPRSTLHLFNGDINIEQIGRGIILRSPNGQCWRITVDNSGNLVTTAITCP